DAPWARENCAVLVFSPSLGNDGCFISTMLKLLKPAGWRLIAVFLFALLPNAEAAALPWQSSGGARASPVQVVPSAAPVFTQLTGDRTGIHFTNTLSYDKSIQNQNFLNGAGVAAGDYDGDGWPDLYFCNLEGSYKLYRNRGDWTFEDVTDKAGAGCGDM